MGKRTGRVCLAIGYLGASAALGLAFLWVPSVPNDAFESPEAQRLFYWHVPSAWMAMIAFGVLFVGSALWFMRRSALGWRLHVAGSEAGLATGLMAVWSGCLWGAAEWGALGLDRRPLEQLRVVDPLGAGVGPRSTGAARWGRVA